ncbi:uncharacterized protein LOC135197342 [Macrobrachium nipponense]|uniref:uncharacterized protein LOC135197342 n=1 Tax=Macrobrachium nipponense TaxID=159736 RepID=UPI0030C8436F
MVHHPETVIVPWFSRQEWLEVYRGIHGNDVERWKEARDCMLVWQARVSKLPIGVDLTLPLLQSKIVSADPFLDSDVKSIMQGTALQRFVSNVVKLPQKKYYNHQTLHKLAAEIGLPGHLVDLRNEIIHGDSGYAGGCTVETALETSFMWIKNYYWYPESTQMNGRTAKRHQNPSRELEVLHEKKKSEQVLSHNFFFYLQAMRKMDKCGCFFNFHAIKGIDTFLKAILINNGSTQLMLNSLLRKLQENKEVASAWIILIVASILKGPTLKGKKGKNGICQRHFLSLQKNGVNWKRIACKLLTLEEEWSVDLATKIMNSSESNISEVQIKKIMSLLDISACKEQDRKSDRIHDISSETSDDELFNVESVLESVYENKTETCDESGKVQVASLLHEAGAMTPLGILPHQIDNKLFYKDLLLHYPDEQDFEPPPKRLKT